MTSLEDRGGTEILELPLEPPSILHRIGFATSYILRLVLEILLDAAPLIFLIGEDDDLPIFGLVFLAYDLVFRRGAGVGGGVPTSAQST